MLAEVWSLLQALRHAEVLGEIITDCAAVVRALERGRVWATAAGILHAAVWCLIWAQLEARDVGAGRQPKDHEGQSAQVQGGQGRAHGGVHTWLNEAADK